MFPSVVHVVSSGPHRLRVEFSDGVVGEVDFREVMKFEGVFAPLRDPDVFAQARVDPEAGTVVWPNGADLDPLVLHSRVTGKPINLDVPAADRL
jgi:hypothetical protein